MFSLVPLLSPTQTSRGDELCSVFLPTQGHPEGGWAQALDASSPAPPQLWLGSGTLLDFLSMDEAASPCLGVGKVSSLLLFCKPWSLLAVLPTPRSHVSHSLSSDDRQTVTNSFYSSSLSHNLPKSRGPSVSWSSVCPEPTSVGLGVSLWPRALLQALRGPSLRWGKGTQDLQNEEDPRSRASVRWTSPPLEWVGERVRGTHPYRDPV